MFHFFRLFIFTTPEAVLKFYACNVVYFIIYLNFFFCKFYIQKFNIQYIYLIKLFLTRLVAHNLINLNFSLIKVLCSYLFHFSYFVAGE